MEVLNNIEQLQLEIHLDAELAQLTYRFRNQSMYLMHTTVPDSFKGKGVGSLLAKSALEMAKLNGHKIAVLCPFVAAYVKRHPEWYALYDRGFHKDLPG